MRAPGSLAALLTSAILVVAACRPGTGEPIPSASSIAGDLVPAREVTVAISLPEGNSTLAAAIAVAAGSESLGGSQITVSTFTSFAGEEQFQSGHREGQIDLYLATVGSVLNAQASGDTADDLVQIAGLQTRDLRSLISYTSDKLSSLSSGPILVQGRPGDELGLLELLASQEAASPGSTPDPKKLTFLYSADPSAPFDITPLVDGTAVAAWVTDFDGLARAYESYRVEDGVQYGIAGVKRILTTSADSQLAGVGIWAHKIDLENQDLLISTAAFLVSLASGAASCRDSALDCAGVVEAGALSDRSGDSLIWSVNEVNRSMWPAPEGLLTINMAAIDAAISLATAAGWGIGSADSAALIDTQAFQLAVDHLPADLDVKGLTWTSIEIVLPLD
jgi:hypothetical protein